MVSVYHLCNPANSGSRVALTMQCSRQSPLKVVTILLFLLK